MFSESYSCLFLSIILKCLKFSLMEDSCILLNLTSPGKVHLTTKLWKDACVMASFSVEGINAARWELCSAAAFLHFDGYLQGDLACRHAREGSSLVRSHKQSSTGIGQHLDERLNFAGDNVGDSIDGSLSSESRLSRQMSVISRARSAIF